MSILVVGVNHRSAPLGMLEQLTLDAPSVVKTVNGLVDLDSVREAVVLSTCNRTEIYVVAERFHRAYDDVRELLCARALVDLDTLTTHSYSAFDDAAVSHLFSVACGLDSVVLGETEILGQVRAAWDLARAEGGARSTLNLLFRHALEVGKLARTETAIAQGTASVSHAAVEMAREALGSLDGRSIAVVGAGSMGEGIAVALHAAGDVDVTVVNRSIERGQQVADRIGGRVVGFDQLGAVMSAADVVLTCTGANEPVITAEAVEPRDADRPLVFIDIAVPRDVAAEVAALGGITVLDLDDLKAWADRGLEQRVAEVAAVQAIVRGAVDRYALDASAMQAAPLVSALRGRFEEIRSAEVARHEGRLDADALEMIDAVTRQLVAKLLHEPSVRLRNEAGSPSGARIAAAVVDLFDLDDAVLPAPSE
jgi:glutamyl-tRNA reductase